MVNESQLPVKRSTINLQRISGNQCEWWSRLLVALIRADSDKPKHLENVAIESEASRNNAWWEENDSEEFPKSRTIIWDCRPSQISVIVTCHVMGGNVSNSPSNDEAWYQGQNCKYVEKCSEPLSVVGNV